jgi:hypothetical protein
MSRLREAGRVMIRDGRQSAPGRDTYTMTRRHDNRQRSYRSYDAEDWQDRWRDQTDANIAQLQRDYINAAQVMIEVREWIKSHDRQHGEDFQSRSRVPDDVRGWISTGIAIASILLTLYLQSVRH